jgi:hypothetical protein
MDHTRDEYHQKDVEMIVALSLTISFIFIELLTFGTGLTMFSGLTSAYCKITQSFTFYLRILIPLSELQIKWFNVFWCVAIMAHASGALLHAYFILDVWDCWLYWWIFTLTACLPLCFDFGAILLDLCRKQLKYKAWKANKLDWFRSRLNWMNMEIKVFLLLVMQYNLYGCRMVRLLYYLLRIILSPEVKVKKQKHIKYCVAPF